MRVNLFQSVLFRLLPVPLAARPAIGSPQTVELRLDELIRLTKGSGVRRIEVRQGLIWLTGTPAGDDVLVRGGDRVELTNHWPFVLQALQNTELLLIG